MGQRYHHLQAHRDPRFRGEPRYIINVVEDVTERRRANEKIAHLAHYDALTDLPNRVLFREQIERSPQTNALRTTSNRSRPGWRNGQAGSPVDHRNPRR